MHTETWSLEDADDVGGFTRKDRGDFSIGCAVDLPRFPARDLTGRCRKANTRLDVLGGNPLLILRDGSKCIGGGDLRASTAIRFICDPSVLSTGV